MAKIGRDTAGIGGGPQGMRKGLDSRNKFRVNSAPSVPRLGEPNDGLSPVRSAGSLLRPRDVRLSRAPGSQDRPPRSARSGAGYGTTDPLEAVLAPGYFAHGSGLLRPGDLIYVSAGAPETRGAAAPGEPRMALVMMRANEQNPARPAGTVRLVQDFGGPGDGLGPVDASAPSDTLTPPAPAKRGRGRPPGSKNKKPGARAAPDGTLAAPARA